MEEYLPAFDSSLGGSQTLPVAYNISELLKERMEEVMMLTEAIQESPFRGQAFQRLPKHMRRRQMSHHIKRLPRRLQRPYLLTLKEGPPKPTKCPSRKYRRRPANLLEEYNRRQRFNIWLETHIWHAKRFHMAKKWGYSLPEAPTNKSFRACYRAVSEHCLLTDISYYNCIQLKGPEETLLKGFMKCTSDDCGLTFGAKAYLTGTREGSLTFYHPNSYPYRPIGNVTFIWKPPASGDSAKIIWIWVHPLIHNEIIECFKDLFQLKPFNHLLDSEQSPEKDNTQDQIMLDPEKATRKRHKKKITKETSNNEQVKLHPKNIPFNRTPNFSNEPENLSMTLLKDTLNRFQLTGPLSQPIISQAFHLIQVSSPPAQETEEEEPDIQIIYNTSGKRILPQDPTNPKNKIIKTSSSSSSLPLEAPNESHQKQLPWWKEYYAAKPSLDNWNLQTDFYHKLAKCLRPTDAPPRIILSLVIGDPRLTLPNKREKATATAKEPFQIQENPYGTSLADGPIWNSAIRDQVSFTKLTTHEINEAKSRKIVPGYGASDVIPDERKSRIPVLLIQRPGVSDGRSGRRGFGSGWDIISPAGYGMPIWKALIDRGARPGGLRETELLNLESSNLSRFIQPDSLAGRMENQEKRSELERRYFRLPPDKRPNYIKLGVPTPFHCPWALLVSGWIKEGESCGGDNEDFVVLRCKRTLGNLDRIMEDCMKQRTVDLKSELGKIKGRKWLVPVLVECLGKGKPRELAMICMPIVEDLEKDSAFPPEEKAHVDVNKEQRKIVKLEHSKLLSTLRRKRRRTRAKLKEEFANNLPGKLKWKDILKSNSAPSNEPREEYRRKMEALWIPSQEEKSEIVNVPSRRIMGFLVKGDFTLSKSVSTGVGYVSLVALFKWLKMSQINGGNKENLKVLIRNRDQVQYRFGKLTILQGD